ncbi:SPOR domain-containing protein [Dechloromonas sp. HYN0024]|uniref:SPOR domain-containing protein n=1 Tax=Dechloromonas sp. HYN0024 TaxID=2231055 RepID=UPI000E438D9A|nr:SPOR domain-containing protein [Dechloromonas sp. HYN0024]AXS80975.1 SPOR domain-containing protein [Dechloromonas sp. HYN0024]
MKALVFLLVLGNLLFYAFAEGYFGRPDNPDAGRVEQQVMPDRMRIVSRGEIPAAPIRAEHVAPEIKPAEEPPATDKGHEVKTETVKEAADKPAPAEPEAKVEKVDSAPVCLTWRPLPAADADRLSTLLVKRFGSYKLSRKVIAAEGNGWWVYIPPLPGKGDADKKAAELRELGISDFFVVPDAPSRLAISLGVFSTEKGAQERLADLKARGVRSAQMSPRPGKDSQVTVLARGPASEKAALLGAVGQLLPKAEALACK